MLNQIVLVGRLTDEIRIIRKDEKKQGIMKIAVQRSYKNAEGVYETDFVECVIYDAIAQNVSEYCKVGDIVGIKGRVQSIPMASGHAIEIVAEKVTFLSSSKSEEGENE